MKRGEVMGKIKNFELASGEKVIRTYSYEETEAKGYSEFSVLTLTNRRLISRSEAGYKQNLQVNSGEIPIEDVDSLEYGFAMSRKPVNILIKIVLLAVAIMGLAILYSGGLMAHVQGALIAGIVLICISAIVFILLLIFRKKQYVFNLLMNRISYDSGSKPLRLNEYTDDEVKYGKQGSSRRRYKKKERRARIQLGVFAIIFIAFLVYAIADFEKNPFLLILAILFIIFFAVALFGVKRRAAKNNTITTKFGTFKAKIDINVSVVQRMLNEIGALILEQKAVAEACAEEKAFFTEATETNGEAEISEIQIEE